MNRIIKLILVLISIYLIVATGLFITFDLKHEMIQGIYVVLYLVVFTSSMIVLTIVYDKDISNYLAFPLYFVIVIGLRAFYQIMIHIDELPLNSEPKYGFDFLIHHTFFTETTFNTFKNQEAVLSLIMMGIVSIVSISLYYKNKKTL